MRLQTFARRYSDATGILALALIAITVFWPIFTGRALFFGDLELFFYPLGEFWHRELVEGRLPLWNPHSLGGVSFAGNPQIGLIYPPNALLAVFPTVTALMFSVVLHQFASGAIFFLWMRRGTLKLGAMASFLGAMCWMLGGAFVSKSQFPNMLAALSWLPAIMWSVEILARRPHLRATTICGAVFGLQLLAAHAQVSLFSIYLGFFYALWNWRIENAVAFWKIASGFAFALVLAALLDAGQLFPVIENLRGAQRQTLSLATAPRFVLPIWALTNFSAPYLYGNPNYGTWTFHGGGNAWETACYLGILPFCLAIYGLNRGRFWSFAALINVIFALGPLGGLYVLAFRFVPGISRFHDAARFLMLAGLALSILAALGLQKLRDNARMRGFVPLLLILSVLDLGVYARNFYPMRDVAQIVSQPRFVGATDEFLQANQARIWTQNPKTARGLLIRYDDYRTRTPENDAPFALGAIPNTQIWNGLLEAGGYDPMAPAAVAARLKSLEIAPDATDFPANYDSRLAEDGIKFFSIWRELPLQNGGNLHEIYRSKPVRGPVRLFVYRNDLLAARNRARNGVGGWQSAVIFASTANSYQFTFERAAGEIVIADGFSPSWKAFGNGDRIEVQPTERGFSLLTPPTAPIQMVYEPQSFRFGVFLSLCALSGIAAVLMTSKTGNKKPETK